VCTYIYIYLHVYMYIYMNTCVYVCIYVYFHIYIGDANVATAARASGVRRSYILKISYVYMSICMYIHVFVYMYVCTYIYIYICIYICVCVSHPHASQVAEVSRQTPGICMSKRIRIRIRIRLGICSADGSTHTESNKLYRKVKH